MASSTSLAQVALESKSKQFASVQTMVNSDSSLRLLEFLEKNNLHKKDFAEMIGVTLSYVYNLLDPQVAFSTRGSTLERIAVVMDTEPDTFPEYKSSEEPQRTDSGVSFLMQRQEELRLTTLQLLKKIPRQQRTLLVDMWRGATQLPMDWSQLMQFAQALELTREEVYPYWQMRFQQYLCAGGMDPMGNIGLLNAMFVGIRNYLKVS